MSEFNYGYGFDTPINVYNEGDITTEELLDSDENQEIDLRGYTNANGELLSEESTMEDLIMSNAPESNTPEVGDHQNEMLDTAAEVDPTGIIKAAKAVSAGIATAGNLVLGDDKNKMKFGAGDIVRSGLDPIKALKEFKATKQRQTEYRDRSVDTAEMNRKRKSLIFGRRKNNNPYQV